MSERIEKVQRQLELMLNEITADQKAFRLILQTFLLKMGEAQGIPRALAMLDDLKASVTGSIDQTEPPPPEATDEERQGFERHKHLTTMRAESFFQEIEAVLDPRGAKPDRAASN